MYYNNSELTRFEKELALLTMNEMKDLEKLSKGDKVMEEAKKKLTNLTEDSIFIGLYDEEEERRKEYNSRMAYAKEQGLEEGREQGLEEGREKGLEEGRAEGIEQNKLEIARKMKEKNIDITLISEVTGLSIEQIEKL